MAVTLLAQWMNLGRVRIRKHSREGAEHIALE